MNAGQYELRLAKDERALGTVTYGTVENDHGTTPAPRVLSADLPSSPASAAQLANATLDAGGTGKYARDHWNDYPRSPTRCGRRRR